jgi:carbon monoxide dehydrogenase subunit G
VQLDHSFTVPVGIDEAWAVLLDIERIAPCLPGAAIDSVDGDDFTGTVKVKLGPIGLTYKGKASFVEKDVLAHRAVIDARGRDARGNGTANAKITATLTDADGATQVEVLTELDITGKPAQFGRSVMAEVGNKLIGQFAACLAAQLAAGTVSGDYVAPVADEAVADEAVADEAVQDEAVPDEAEAQDPPARHAVTADEPAAAVPAAPKPSLTKPSTQKPHAPEPEPINLLESAGPAVLKRLAPLLGAALLVVLLRRRRRRRRA